jgi:anti-sigma regulatory factor (Ser/Thr protein kinase)
MPRRAVEDDLGDVGAAIAWAGQWTGTVPEDARFALEVCVEEALANLITHGRAVDGAKDIALTVSADAAGATVEISDRCAPYDVAHAAPSRQEKAGGLLEGGRGLKLIHAFARDLAYASEPGGNKLTMTFGEPGARPAR